MLSVDAGKVPKPPPVRSRDSRRISRRETATNPGGLNPETVRKIFPAVRSYITPPYPPLSLLSLSLSLILPPLVHFRSLSFSLPHRFSLFLFLPLILPHFSTPDFLSFSFFPVFFSFSLSFFYFLFFPAFFLRQPRWQFHCFKEVDELPSQLGVATGNPANWGWNYCPLLKQNVGEWVSQRERERELVVGGGW